MPTLFTPTGLRFSNNMNVLRIALVGCGAISESFYAPAIAALASQEGLSVSCLVDPEQQRLSVLGTLFPSALQLTQLDRAKSDEFDLAIVASPQRFHAEQTISLLTQGVHVLCEKPLASNLTEAKAMVRVAMENDCLLAVGLFRRFFPITQWIRDLVSGKDLGSPLRFSWSEGGVFDWPAATTSFFRKEASAGGVFADLGAHVLDLLLHWFGQVADFYYQDDAMGGLEANAFLDLSFDNGVKGRVRLSRDTRIPNSVWIEFERGIVWFQGGTSGEITLQLKHCDFVAKSNLHHKLADGQSLCFAPGSPCRSYAQSFQEQIRNLCRAIRGQDSLHIPASDSLISISLIENCYANRSLINMPWLSENEQAAADSLAY
jgi:predicted dehydrogenase